MKKPITIYVVDDYLLTRIANKRYFADDCEFSVIGDFSNAKDCFRALDKNEPDIILMDIELSDINGIEAVKIIHDKFPSVKVIMLTQYNDKASVSASLACGACGYVLKNDSNVFK